MGQLRSQPKVSFASVARSLGVSHETVRKDVARFLGPEEFTHLSSLRRGSVRPSNPSVLSLKEAAAFFLARSGSPTEVSDGTRNVAIAQAVTLDALDQRGVQATVNLCHSRVSFLESPAGAIALRCALVDGSLREHAFGLHRFKVSPSIERTPFAAFSVVSSDGQDHRASVYVFKTVLLARLRSLNLRYSKHGSKYQKYLNQWSTVGE